MSEKPARNKHSSLLGPFISDEENKVLWALSHSFSNKILKDWRQGPMLLTFYNRKLQHGSLCSVGKFFYGRNLLLVYKQLVIEQHVLDTNAGKQLS
jgi:hypothetical protein